MYPINYILIVVFSKNVSNENCIGIITINTNNIIIYTIPINEFDILFHKLFIVR